MPLLILTLCIIPALLFTSPAESRNLELADYLNWEQVADPQLSPDGKQILYTRSRVNKIEDRTDNEIWQMTVDGERNRFLLTGGKPRWSPSGNRIAYIGVVDGKPQLFVRWMDAEGSTTQITYDTMAPNDYEWSPDGKSIAFRAQVPVAPALTINLPPRPAGAKWTAEPAVIDRLHYRTDRVGMKVGHDHLFVVSADGGTPKQLTNGDWSVGRRFSGMDFEITGAFRWTNDGKALLFSGEMDRSKETEASTSQIHKVDVSTGTISTVMGAAGSWGVARPSPNGKLIAYMGQQPSDKVWPASEIRVMNSDGSNSRVLMDQIDSPMGFMQWAPNSKGLYLALEKEGTRNIYLLDLNGKLKAVTKGDQMLGLDSIRDGKLITVYTTPTITPNVASVNLRNGAINQITDVNGDILGDVELSDAEEIWYKSSGDTDVQGWIIKPPNFDPNKKYPLILEIHGGPNAMYGVGFNFRFQQFAAEDYVVLYTNPRGSTGYGVEFTQAINNAYPGQADFDDLMAGVDTVLDKGYIDDDRLYVTGCSGGGALTAWVVGHTDRFAAAASLCPVINWISMAGTADVAGWSMKQFKTPHWEDPTPWLEHSPIMHVGKVTTPTMLITGANDLRTPLAQAEEFYAALKKRGVPTVLIPMNNEWHGTWTVPSNMLRTQLFLQKWFETYPGDGDSEKN